MIDNATAQFIRSQLDPIKKEIIKLRNENDQFKAVLINRPKSLTEELDAIPGRRLFYTLSGTQTFTTAQAAQRGQPINFLISQDGIFVMTHYPAIMWKTDLPTNATDFGRWRPVASWPLPTQQLTTNFIDISYEISDGGSQRNFQNLPVNPCLISRPDNMIPLPVPTPFAPNTTIQLTPTYEAITFGGSTATTEGTLVVALPGYKIVNM